MGCQVLGRHFDGLFHEGNDEFIEALEPAVEELRAPPQLAQRDPGGVADGATGPGPQRSRLAHQRGYGVPCEPGPQVIGPVTIRDLAWLMVWVRSARALRLATISARIASTEPPGPWRAAGPAGLRGPGGADGVQRVFSELTVLRRSTTCLSRSRAVWWRSGRLLTWVTDSNKEKLAERYDAACPLSGSPAQTPPHLRSAQRSARHAQPSKRRPLIGL
jgi:hypothetical protein